MKNVGAGIDNISGKIFKAVYEKIIHKLTYFVNLCLETGQFPSNLKIAIVKPIFKTGDKRYMSNYRPISILPYISKILEKIIYDRIINHLNFNNILCPNQFGFRKGLSTYMPLLLVQEKVTKAFENNKIVCGIYLDLKKAFDTVDHNILISKLSAYGMLGTFLNIIISYLSNRTQCVAYLNSVSGLCSLNIGVPQGSILGPLLFLLYINDFPNICKKSSCILYADDTAIFFEADNASALQTSLNMELPRICKWFKTNKLSLNTTKTFCQLYNNSSKNITINVNLDGVDIKFVEKVKYLGMYIDANMKWKSHIDHISKVISRNIGIIKKSTFFLDEKHLILLYNSLCLPYLNYCSLVWGHSSDTLLHKLEILQKKVIRIIDGQGRFSHTSPIFAKLKLLKVRDITKQQIITVMHNVLLGRAPTIISSMFTLLQDNSRASRQNSHFQEPYTRKLYRSRTVFWLGPRLWNKMISPSFPQVDEVPVSKQSIKEIVKNKIIMTYVENR